MRGFEGWFCALEGRSSTFILQMLQSSGLRGHGKSVGSGVKVTAAVCNFVDDGVDPATVSHNRTVPVLDSDTRKTISSSDSPHPPPPPLNHADTNYIPNASRQLLGRSFDSGTAFLCGRPARFVENRELAANCFGGAVAVLFSKSWRHTSKQHEWNRELLIAI